jgi:hypothetical protein
MARSVLNLNPHVGTVPDLNSDVAIRATVIVINTNKTGNGAII